MHFGLPIKGMLDATDMSCFADDTFDVVLNMGPFYHLITEEQREKCLKECLRVLKKYFYAQYIFLRIREVEEVYNSLQRFDVDSEVFELTLAMMKQKDEPRYQELMEYIFNKTNEEVKGRSTNLSAFNILTLLMRIFAVEL